VTHFTEQNLAHMGPKKPVRESLSIPGPARKNEIAGQVRTTLKAMAPRRCRASPNGFSQP
jgi:hypothetical protein